MKKVSVAWILFLIGAFLILLQYTYVNGSATQESNPDGNISFSRTEGTPDSTEETTEAAQENVDKIFLSDLVDKDYQIETSEPDIEVEPQREPEAEPETEHQAEPTEEEWFMKMTPDEIRDFAALVYLEAGSESYECQKGIASVVVNRMITRGQSFYTVVYAENQFSPACNIPYTTASDSCYQAVYEVLKYGPTLPWNCTYFRANYYHSWSSLVQPYTVIDHTYFSLDLTLVQE